MKLGRVHGGVAVHKARWWCHCSGEPVMGHGSPSSVMVLGLVEVRKHMLEGNDGV